METRQPEGENWRMEFALGLASARNVFFANGDYVLVLLLDMRTSRKYPRSYGVSSIHTPSE